MEFPRYTKKPPVLRGFLENSLEINLFSVRYLHNLDESILIINPIYHPIIPLTDSIPLLPGEFLAPYRPWILAECANFFYDEPGDLFRNPLQFLDRCGLDEDFIFDHAP